MSSEKCSPHTKQVDMMILFYTCIFEFFVSHLSMLCGEIYGHDPKCMSVFQASTAAVLVTQTDVATNHWTILRVMN